MRPSRLRRRKGLACRTGLTSDTRLKRTPIRPVSDRQRDEWQRRAELRARLAAERGDACELRTPVCTGRQQGLHHLRKASQGGRTVEGNVLLSCNACNTWCEDNPARARTMGLVIMSWEGEDD